MSTKSVKFQIATAKAPKLVEACDILPVDFRSNFGTVSQGIRKVFALSEGV